MNGFAGTNTAIPMWNSAANSQHPRETGREGGKGEGGSERVRKRVRGSPTVRRTVCSCKAVSLYPRLCRSPIDNKCGDSRLQLAA